jgi:hypothetical protein
MLSFQFELKLEFFFGETSRMRDTKSIDLVNMNDGTNCPPFVQTFDQKKSESFAEGKEHPCSSVFMIEMETISELRI